MVKISKERRAVLRAAIYEVIERMAPEVAEEISDQLFAYPFPAIPDDRRDFNLLVREAYKLMIDAQLKQDGNRDRLKRDALGSRCSFCEEAMTDLKEMELDHECYHGRPPRAVHKHCHKAAPTALIRNPNERSEWPASKARQCCFDILGQDKEVKRQSIGRDEAPLLVERLRPGVLRVGEQCPGTNGFLSSHESSERVLKQACP